MNTALLEKEIVDQNGNEPEQIQSEPTITIDPSVDIKLYPLDPRVATFQSPEASQNDKIQAFESIYKEFYPVAKKRAENITHNPLMAEDIAQEALTKVLVKLPEYKPIAPLAAWITRISSNASFDALKKGSKRFSQETFDPSAFETKNPDFNREGPAEIGMNPADIYEQKYEPHDEKRQEKLAKIREAMSKLSEGRRGLLELSSQGVKDKEIAEKLGIPITAVKARLYRARHELRNQISDNKKTDRRQLETIHALNTYKNQKTREVLELSLQGLNAKQIAARTGLSPNSVTQRLSRGRSYARKHSPQPAEVAV